MIREKRRSLHLINPTIDDEMKNTLWRFTSDNGDFESKDAFNEKTLYFPLANEHMMSSVTPDLHGDAKTGQDAFLYEPLSRIDLVNSRSSRNFWTRTSSGKVWSATGVSKDIAQMRSDKCVLSAGLLWHRVERENKAVGLRSNILIFVPSSGEPAEVMSVTLTNISSKTISFVSTAAIPIYGRSAENIRDHRHVTTLLNRISTDRFGVTVKPTLLFSESGHAVNENTYFVMGCDDLSRPPQYLYPTQELFCGKGDLESPDAVLLNTVPMRGSLHGKEAFGGLRFARTTLKPGGQRTYIIVSGVTKNILPGEIFSHFDTIVKIEEAFAVTQRRWSKEAAGYEINTGDRSFDNWYRWVGVQPTLRRIFGCSFLPDFDYGKGGRGWRDLWQDCLGLILNKPEGMRELLLNNFSGIRIDGSNATIVGKKPGEFISDRNNVSRVWMDHGLWPLLTLELYMDETGDNGILFETVSYFCDHNRARSRIIDHKWKTLDGNMLKTVSGKVYDGTVFEHLLLENLVQFFNVGAHNHIRLEGADWNDGLDMAREHGESAAFTAMYARNLLALAALVKESGRSKIELAEEAGILFGNVDYDNVSAKHDILNKYFHATNHGISGEKISFEPSRICEDLKAKAMWMMGHIRKSEWLAEGFFNGYYDNDKERVEGRRGGAVRMSLTSQVFPIMGGVALESQIKSVLSAGRKYLYDRRLGGWRLNTDFGSQMLNLGRAFSFSYGDKENGAFFNHMVVMFANALYRRGFVDEGWGVLRSIYDMALDTEASRIYPCLPEYFNIEGRGMYSYLTGSASWFILTMITEVFGLKGHSGDLLVEPKLCPEQFGSSSAIKVSRTFAGRRFVVSFSNPGKKRWGRYRISKATLNDKSLALKDRNSVVIKRALIKDLAADEIHTIDIILE